MPELSFADLLVLAAAGSYVVGYLIINQVILRLFLLLGSGFYIAYYATVADDPLWTAIWTSAALLVANATGLALLIVSRSRWALGADLSELYDNVDLFKDMPPGDFRLVMQAGRRKKFHVAKAVVEEGQPNDTLYFLISGGSHTLKRGHGFRMPAGIFVGEVSYMLNAPASATVTIDAGSEAMIWDFATLREKSRRARFRIALEAMISRDLSRKVSHAVAPDPKLFTEADYADASA